ncbi:MAG: ABC transporter ATP-binding protein [Pirellulales bacterium]|nr:ABC transporter ATP-binding protein [Pirellulales bacterium]
MMHDLVLQTRDLTKAYGDALALDRLSLEICRGQIMGLVGANGAGKTTTIRILVGQLRPTSGSALINGVDCTGDAARLKRVVGYMPDVFGGYDNMRVFEYLDFFAAAFGIPRKARIKRIDEVAEMTGARPLRDCYVESLSHGMKQRVALARTLLHDPELIILDEPANGLDPQARIEMRRLLRDLAGCGKTLLVTSHILPELSRICDVVAILAHGKLCAAGTLDEVVRHVRQRRLFEIELASADYLDVAQSLIIRHVPTVADVVASVVERTIRFYTTEPDFDLSDTLSILVGAEIKITQCREAPMDLEEAFITIADRRADPAACPVPVG